ncbi:STAS domain-containing protein [Aliikangiella sp. G2MR2-5]|uniref:STAS domain-containing protein n=1 Tax=Aliikangiella sp. G2MR2-5 TaxID=2788943 RepID=UPI0018AC69DF|nr:STAS domain-containing protein [Aliikangiella sp. G2MR2-5]
MSNKKTTGDSDKTNKIQSQQKEIDGLYDQIESSRFDLPMLKIAERVLMVPLVGAVDSVKSQKIMEDVLDSIKPMSLRVVVLDIAGIKVVDSAVAAHLIKIAKATKLMGCKTIITGISPIISQNIVNLGVDVRDIDTTSTLQDGMQKAYEAVGLKLVQFNE